MATKMMKLSLPVVVVDAPSAMPSAQAWMTRPTVVDDGRDFVPWWCDEVAGSVIGYRGGPFSRETELC